MGWKSPSLSETQGPGRLRFDDGQDLLVSVLAARVDKIQLIRPALASSRAKATLESAQVPYNT
jgi:hypothetical protein